MQAYTIALTWVGENQENSNYSSMSFLQQKNVCVVLQSALTRAMSLSNPTQKNSDLEQFYKLNDANNADIDIPDFSSELLVSLMSTDAQKNDLYAPGNDMRSLLSWRKLRNFRIVNDMVPNLQSLDHNNLIYKISIDCEKKVSALLMLCEREIGNSARNITPILEAI